MRVDERSSDSYIGRDHFFFQEKSKNLFRLQFTINKFYLLIKFSQSYFYEKIVNHKLF